MTARSHGGCSFRGSAPPLPWPPAGRTTRPAAPRRERPSPAARRFGTMLDLCRKSSFNPTTNKYYAFAPGWVPDPGDYRKSLWEPVGMGNGPTTYDDLLKAGAEIKGKTGMRVGIGMSPEVDSN